MTNLRKLWCFEALFTMAQWHLRLLDYKNAIEYFQKALTLEDDNWRIYAHLGDIYKSVRDFERSIVYFDKAEQLSPNNPDILFSIAELFKEIGSFSCPFASKFYFAFWILFEAIDLSNNCSSLHFLRKHLVLLEENCAWKVAWQRRVALRTLG